jgi:AcrR family transcriptional regulator
VTSSRAASSRSYRLGRRQEGIAATRDRIVAAAREGLLSGQPLTLNGVAERAQVSRPTVYHHFNNRRGLLDAVIADSQEESLAGAITAAEHPDPITAVLGWLGAAVEFWTREADMMLLAWRVSEGDSELSGAFEDQEQARLRRARTLVERLFEKNFLRRAWTIEQATVFLWLLSGPYSLQQLRGTTPDPVGFALETASQALLTSAGRKAARRIHNRQRRDTPRPQR